jgi:DNA polymerase/3'-5' exonuclease PolX
MNTNILDEFNRLIAFIQEDIDKLTAEKNLKALTANQFRLKQIKNVFNILKNYQTKITINNYMELKEINGIGKGTIDRIKEILLTGKLSELGNFVDNKKDKNKTIEDLESVVGIGHTHAIELYNKGITSVKQLKKKVKEGSIEVNEKIELGLKYYGKFEGNIPRKEIDKVYKIFKDIFKNLNKKLKPEEQYIFEFCGSYRREKPVSGDIDILISKKGKLNEETNYLLNIIKLLKEPIKKNEDQPLLIDDLTDLGKTKYMGFGKYLDNPFRRIDIRFIPYESYFSGLLYFTGSAELNKKMRQIAKLKKLKLSEYGLFKENGDKITINDERDVFNILEIEYLVPRLR